ncbi:MAG: cytochrome c oxidase subunit 3 [Sandaracinaceae bacterium]|nr:cytochrome c oxidase subunit 3 [Sandaracinaceae bacterium]
MIASSVAVLPVRRRPVVPSAVLGMLVFVATEAMFFAGLVSAFAIVRSRSMVAWPPPGQPRLPIEATALTSLALLASGVLVFAAWRAFARGEPRARGRLLAGLLLGAFFLTFQGVEWVRLIGEGLTLTTSTHASFFYLIIGAHAVHVVFALGVVVRAYALMRLEKLAEPTMRAALVLWTFVVGVRPLLYVLVYLGGGS